MKLCMFHPVDHPMERGWVGRIEDDRVVHLAAQTLQAFFTGGGARDHAVYPREAVRLLAPVLHPPSVRVFDDETSFEFRNPAAILGPGTEVVNGYGPDDWFAVDLRPRLAAIVGADGAVAGFTVLSDWRAPSFPAPKDRDFALGLGPIVVTVDEADPHPEARVRVHASIFHPEGEQLRGRFDFDWWSARDLSAERTRLLPGDILACPALGVVDTIEPATVIEIEVDGIGTLEHTVHPEVELA